MPLTSKWMHFCAIIFYIYTICTFFSKVAWVHLIAPLVRSFASSVNLALYLCHLRQGVVTSGVIFLFWLLETLFGIITVRSVLMTDYVTGDDRLTPFTNYVIQFSLVCAAFFLSCWADVKPSYVNLDGKSKIVSRFCFTFHRISF